jgi:3-methylfumaryl-CoA hydratase
MVFVTVNHEIRGAGQPLVREAHDIVYREAPLPGAAPPAGSPADRTADLERTVVPDAVMLFRYSALTFNGHRIHYDRAYCRDIEQYPGLVVHGPLIATLLMDLLHRGWPQAQVRRFEFKAVSPLFDGAPITLRARRDGDARIALWAADEAGRLAMRADADITFS